MISAPMMLPSARPCVAPPAKTAKAAKKAMMMAGVSSTPASRLAARVTHRARGQDRVGDIEQGSYSG
jgi:hypothetical protein